MTIKGLHYIPEFISQEQSTLLLGKIDQEPWLDDLKRRVQHYGFKYDYKKRNIDMGMKIGELPEWAMELVSGFQTSGYMPYPADQLIINEYLPGQGIAAHIDCEPCFEDFILSLSLGSHCVMEFISKDKSQSEELLLEAGSLLLMSGEARYEWMHGIKARKTDFFEDRKLPRSRRVSLTFRKVIL